jgi:hydrogenase maturation protease
MLKVIALGNSLRGDDGIGSMVLDLLRQQVNNSDVLLLDTGSDPFTLLEQLIQPEPVLIIDCARMGRQPGDVVKFRIDQSNLAWADEAISLHGFSLAEVYQMAQKLGPVAGCQIIGVEPKSIAFNQKISPEVKNSIPVVLQMVNEEISINEKQNNHN